MKEMARFVILSCAYWSLLAQPALCMADFLTCRGACCPETEPGESHDESACQSHYCNGWVISGPETRPRADGFTRWISVVDAAGTSPVVDVVIDLGEAVTGSCDPPGECHRPFAESDIPLLI